MIKQCLKKSESIANQIKIDNDDIKRRVKEVQQEKEELKWAQ